jgi:YfiH family protein
MTRSTTNGLPAPGASFEWRQAPWGDVLVCRELDPVASHFFTGRQLQLRGDSPDAHRDWGQVADAVGVPADRLWRMRQVHGCDVFRVNDGAPAMPPQVDAIVTDRRDVALAVQVADCVPLLLADPRTGAVAATHAGWRGTAANVAAATVMQLTRDYGARPTDLIAAIGPSIGPACFQVGPEVRDAFVDGLSGSGNGNSSGNGSASLQPERWFAPDTGDRLRLDIWRANHDQLVAAGLDSTNVHIAGLCTVTHVLHFFSYRREQQATGRLLGVIRSRQGK